MLFAQHQIVMLFNVDVLRDTNLILRKFTEN